MSNLKHFVPRPERDAGRWLCEGTHGDGVRWQSCGGAEALFPQEKSTFVSMKTLRWMVAWNCLASAPQLRHGETGSGPGVATGLRVASSPAGPSARPQTRLFLKLTKGNCVPVQGCWQ